MNPCFILWLITCYYPYLFWCWNVAGLARMSPFKMVPTFLWQILIIFRSFLLYGTKHWRRNLCFPCISPVISLFLRSLGSFEGISVCAESAGVLFLGPLRAKKHVCVHTCTHTHTGIVVDMKTHNSDPLQERTWCRDRPCPNLTLSASPHLMTDWGQGIKLAILVQREQLWEAMYAPEPSWPRQSWASIAVQCPLQPNPSPSMYFDP